ncbi:MAG: tetratricopeptide repeat protein [Legionella sp.]|nr:tetratricopeptide repeat protein [Legionella sp.]
MSKCPVILNIVKDLQTLTQSYIRIPRAERRSRFFIFCLIYFSSPLQIHAFSWQDLWATPDQQAQVLMKKNQVPKAKALFRNKDWSATASYTLGDYKEAAQLFNHSGENGFYNYGNALARLKQYEQAIKAYDKALALNPKDEDALYNRKLVQELLQQEKQKKDKQKKNQQNKDQQNKDQQNQDQQNKDQQNKDQQNNGQQNKDQQNKDQQNKDQQNQDQQNKDQQNKDQQNKDQQNKDQQKKDQQNKDQQIKEQQNKDQQNKDQQNKAKVNKNQLEADREKQQAKQQWLQLIPDDPGGLMREKFLRDHLRRQRGWYQ